MKELIGRTVRRVFVSQGENQMFFDTSEGVMTYDAIGDCCSESWFADVFTPEALLGQTVIACEYLDLPYYSVLDGRCRDEYDEVYGIKLTTAKGVTVIAFRNSSNGYYGGELEYNAAQEQTIPGDAREITEDWAAGWSILPL